MHITIYTSILNVQKNIWKCNSTLINYPITFHPTYLNTLKHSYPKIIAVILEAVLISGDSAIWHTATNYIAPNIKYIPFLYYIAPYIGIIACLSYFPAGKQSIWSINHETFPQDIPFIIIHSDDDRQLPFNGACALYYKLTEKNKNVYFKQKTRLVISIFCLPYIPITNQWELF